MAFDGITTACITHELSAALVGGRIYKIAQPETDELILTVKKDKDTLRLLLSASASLPLVYLTSENKPSPLTAPGFCMLLRKHLQNGRIVSVTQPGLERIIQIHVEHLDEMGDLCRKTLVIELMGKHSNIIFLDDNNMIIDSIKHISSAVSSVREVLPGRDYFIPDSGQKHDPLSCERELFFKEVFSKPLPLYKALYSTFTGLSPIISQELCFSAKADADMAAGCISDESKELLWKAFRVLIKSVLEAQYSPAVYYDQDGPAEYSVLPLTIYADLDISPHESISELLFCYYNEKSRLTRIRQKSSDLRRIVQTLLERNIKKYDLQLKQIKDTEKKDTFRVYGELLNTYGYNLPEGATACCCTNYYTGEDVSIPLDSQLSASENAKKYFEKYNKLKRTGEALKGLTITVKEEIEHLESIMTSLDMALYEEDLVEIKQELSDSGYIRKHGTGKREKVTSRPLHYISTDGYDIYVGKNNYQNDYLTFKFAASGDWWFHAKGIPGSHVILKTPDDGELPDRAFEEAAAVAAHYSRGASKGKTEIDYVQKKHVKKPSGSKPGFVVYYTNYSMVADSDISRLRKV